MPKYIEKATIGMSDYGVYENTCEAVLFDGKNLDEVVEFLKSRVTSKYFRTPPKIVMHTSSLSETMGEQVPHLELLDCMLFEQNMYLIPSGRPDTLVINVDSKEAFESKWEKVDDNA